MRQHVINTVLFGLRVAAIFTLSLLMAAVLFSFKADKSFSDIWKQLGLTERDGATHVKQSFIYGYLQYAGTRAAKNIASADRASVAKDMMAFTRQYVQGADFKAAYEQERQSKKPQEPRKPKTEDEVRKEQIASTKEGIASMEKGMKTATADIKKMLQPSYEMLQKQLKEYQDPNNQMIKMIAEGEVSSYQYQLTAYKEDLKKWEAEYPANPAPFIKKRLQQMLDATKDIDYNAELVERHGKKYFAKTVYEQKSSHWKMGYRAGKEVTETARAFAQEWIKELQ